MVFLQNLQETFTLPHAQVIIICMIVDEFCSDFSISEWPNYLCCNTPSAKSVIAQLC